MSTLFDLAGQFLRLKEDLDEAIDQCPDGEPTEAITALIEAIEQDMASNTEERSQKFDNYCSLIRHYVQYGVIANAEAERIAQRASRYNRKAEWLRDRLKAVMETMNMRKIETPANTISIVNNGGQRPLSIQVEPERLPVEYRKEVKTWQPDKVAIRTALEGGAFIPGCVLQERGNRIAIK